jgi:hypothetical protein
MGQGLSRDSGKVHNDGTEITTQYHLSNYEQKVGEQKKAPSNDVGEIHGKVVANAAPQIVHAHNPGLGRGAYSEYTPLLIGHEVPKYENLDAFSQVQDLLDLALKPKTDPLDFKTEGAYVPPPVSQKKPFIIIDLGATNQTENISNSKSSELSVSSTSDLVTYFGGTRMYSPESNSIVKRYMACVDKRTNFAKNGRLFEEAFNRKNPALVEYAAMTAQWRKTYFYNDACEVLQTVDYDQMVLFGDGMNPMVIALANEYPDKQFYCTDNDEDLVAQRQKILKELGISNVHCLYHDGNSPETLKSALHMNGCDTSKPVYAHMEGFVSYLQPSKTHELINTFVDMNPYNRVLINYIDTEKAMAKQPMGQAYRDGAKLIQELTGAKTTGMQTMSVAAFDANIDQRFDVNSPGRHTYVPWLQMTPKGFHYTSTDFVEQVIEVRNHGASHRHSPDSFEDSLPLDSKDVAPLMPKYENISKLGNPMGQPFLLPPSAERKLDIYAEDFTEY